MSTTSDASSAFDTTANENQAGRASQIWMMLGILWRSRWIIISITVATAVLSIVISLLLPNWFMGQTRLLLPARPVSGLLSGALIGSLPPATSSLLGGVTGDYQRYLSILDSRTVKESVVQHFDLVTIYDTKDSLHPKQAKQDALELLQDNIEFVVDQEYNHLVVQAYDQNPQRAADIANFFVEELNRIHGQLSSQSAAAFREKVEQRYAAIETGLDSLRTHLRNLQARYGVIDPATQGQTFMEGIVALRANSLLAEIEHARLLSFYGPNHSAVRSAKDALDIINNQYSAALAGEEAVMPVPQDSIPNITQQFHKLETELLILGSLIEYVRPVLEEARLEEQRKSEAVQVVDRAVAPPRKARPWRAAIVVSSTFSSFLLATIFVLLWAWWHGNHAAFADRFRTAITESSL